MKKVMIFLAAGAAMTAVTPAYAQYDDTGFSGPRVEGIIGYDSSRAGSDADNDVNDEDDQSIEGVMYGIGIGYDVDTGSAVFGVEGEYTDSSAKTEFSDGGDFEGFGLGRVDTGRDLYLGVRAGAKLNPMTLLYAKAGYTNAKYNALARDGVNELRQDIDTDGWRVGAGLERKLGTNAYAKIEYRYSKYGEAEFDNGDLPDSDRFDIDIDRHQAVAAVGWRF